MLKMLNFCESFFKNLAVLFEDVLKNRFHYYEKKSDCNYLTAAAAVIKQRTEHKLTPNAYRAPVKAKCGASDCPDYLVTILSLVAWVNKTRPLKLKKINHCMLL
jgi:hypothetical protein